jgi:hypothetical protein
MVYRDRAERVVREEWLVAFGPALVLDLVQQRIPDVATIVGIPAVVFFERFLWLSWRSANAASTSARAAEL